MAIIKAVSSKSPIKTAIVYVSKDEKTNQKLLSGYNLSSPETAYDEMQITKEIWNKTNGRTYKHYVQSFAPDEAVTSEQAHAIAKEFVESCPQFKGFEVLIATHQDREHIHTHFILNSVSFEDGHKFQQKSTELQNIALAIMECKEQAKSREQFIDMMNANGYGVVWTDNRKYITFTDLTRQKQGEKQCKIRNSKLEKYYHVDFSKEGLKHEFADNARKQQEEHNQAVRANTIAQHGRVAVIDTRTVLKESGAVLDQSATVNSKLRLDRDDTRIMLIRADTKVKSSTASRTDREVERERLSAEESRRIAEQAERERKALEERSKKKSRGGFER